MAANDLEGQLLCLLCCKAYDTPRQLPCHHSFCEGCLQTYIGTVEIPADDTHGTFPCPACTKPVHPPDSTEHSEDWASLFPLNSLYDHVLNFQLPSVPSAHLNILCDPCQMVNESNKAEYRCLNCSQHLCSSCMTYHLKNKFTSKHDVNPIHEDNDTPVRPSYIATDCKDHRGKTIDRFCRQHRQLCCSSCVSSRHKECADVSSIDDVIRGGAAGSVGEATRKELEHMRQEVTSLGNIKEDNIKRLDCENAKLLVIMTSIVDATKNKLDDLLEVFKDNLHQQWEDNREKLVSELEHVNRFSLDLANNSFLISALPKKCSPSQTFIAQDMIKSQVKDYFQQIKSILEKDVDIADVDMDMQMELLDAKLVNAFRDFGGVSASETTSERTRDVIRIVEENVLAMDDNFDLALQEETANLTKRSVSMVVEMLGGKQLARLTGCSYLPNGKCLMADQKHRRLLLFDSQYKIEKAITIDKPPSDIVFSSRHHSVLIAVGYYFDKEIYRYRFENDSLDYQDKIKVPKGTWGISLIDDVILAGCPNTIEIISIDGTALNSFPTNGVCTFVGSCRRTNSFWFKDGDDVVCMKLDGTSGFRYHDEKLKGLSGISCDKFGNAYVCSRDSGHVHQILKDGSSGRVLLKMQHNITRPCGLEFHPSKHEFVITSDGESTAFEVYTFD